MMINEWGTEKCLEGGGSNLLSVLYCIVLATAVRD
jgi:hypothetical protein